MNRLLTSLLLAALCSSAALAADVPEPGDSDARVRYVTYKKDGVTVINVQRGVITRLILADDEKIAKAATGFPADCKKDELEWCVHTDVGDNQVWVKPKDNATHNNLEMRTDKRDYSIEFQVLGDEPRGRGKREKSLQHEAMYRVIFRYPFQAPPLAALMTISAAQAAAAQQASEKSLLVDRMDSAKPAPRNWKYSMQVLDGADEIAPSMVFDDGRFTYFRFAANREVPTIYYISPTGEESRINFHMEGDLAVVDRRAVLRSEAIRVVGVERVIKPQ